ncbi:MAG TPA: MBL fold metallo-hydrolase [Vicinamibacterales bacterium]|nr:MBL fold metallo-hydrolase [Vicinamibacterales bacterium]
MKITLLPLVGLLFSAVAPPWLVAVTLHPIAVADSRSDAKALEIYFIDVEGGQSTLIVTPAGQSLLVDTGFPGAGTMQSPTGDPRQARDAQRILAAAHHAGLKAIDYLLITHFHPDHDGGVPELAELIPIRTFIDHGSVSPNEEQNVPGTIAAFDAYTTVRAKGRHIEPKPGDRLPLNGINAVIVSSAGSTIVKPLAGGGAPNPACDPSAPLPQAGENPRSTGLRLQFGRFRFVDLGDLSGNPLFGLFCPNDLLGVADLYLLPHHGNADVSDPAMFGAVRPRVAIMNNGATKGGAPEMFVSLHRAQGIEDVWQLHRSENEGALNFADDRIANLDQSTDYWIKVSAQEDGSFVVTNARTGASKMYTVLSGSSRR